MKKGVKTFLGVCAFCTCLFPLTHADAKTLVNGQEYDNLQEGYN